MSFWSDASPITKGLIVVGGLGILYLGIAFFTKSLPPFNNAYDTQTTRGMSQ